jgi:hypothetical protein
MPEVESKGAELIVQWYRGAEFDNTKVESGFQVTRTVGPC